MVVKNLYFYLADATVILQSDHLTLKQFLQKLTLNAKVDNWEIGLSDYNTKFKSIKGVKTHLPIIYPGYN